jgi:pyruvate,water dikinase
MSTLETDAESALLAPYGIAWFTELRRGDAAQAGGKGANLGELTAAGLPVPNGFVLLAQAYLDAMETGSVRDLLMREFLEVCRLAESREGSPEIAKKCEHLRALVRKVGIPSPTL